MGREPVNQAPAFADHFQSKINSLVPNQPMSPPFCGFFVKKNARIGLLSILICYPIFFFSWQNVRYVVITMFLACLTSFFNTTFADQNQPILNFVKSGKAPETKWLPYNTYLHDIEQAGVEWQKTKILLEQQLTLSTLRENLDLNLTDLGFAEGYSHFGALLSSNLQPYAHIDKGRGQHWLVLEGRYGPLTASNPLVERWIKTYVTYDTLNKKIIRVTMAIDGQKLE
jgi:hypothetical protein